MSSLPLCSGHIFISDLHLTVHISKDQSVDGRVGKPEYNGVSFILVMEI